MRRALRHGAERRRCPGRGDRGAAAVEFALVVPLLLVLVFGIINFGDFLSVRQTVTQAAAEGARAAAVASAGQDPVEEARGAVEAALSGYGATCDDGELTCDISIGACEGGSGDTCASVEVAISKGPLIPGFGFGDIIPDDAHYTAVARVND